MTRNVSALLVLSAIFTTGCDVLDPLGDLEHDRTLLNVAVTHHATPEAGTFPDRGGAGELRTFDTDDGWTITLLNAFVTSAGVTLHRCDDAPVVLGLYAGPLAEDLRGADLDTLTLGGVDLGASQFCSATITYGPYPTNAPMTGLEPEVAGATFWIDGGASLGDTTVPFQIRSEAPIVVDVDLSQVDDGAPLRISGGEDFPVELVLSKTYDRLFDAVDFTTATNEDLTAQVAAALALETRATVD